MVAVGFEGITRSDLSSDVDDFEWQVLGRLGDLIRRFGEAGVQEAVMAGKVSVRHWLSPDAGVPIEPDARALGLIESLADRRDDSLLGALADCLEAEGVRLAPQARFVPDLVPPPGPLGRHGPSPSLARDVAFGWRIAKGLAGLDVGQTAVVRERTVLAVEAMEGTDRTIRRGGEVGGAGATVVKVARPGQDPRFDLPAMGTGTLEAALDAEVACLAFEAGTTLVLDREELVERADRAGLVILGIPPEGPSDPDAG